MAHSELLEPPPQKKNVSGHKKVKVVFNTTHQVGCRLNGKKEGGVGEGGEGRKLCAQLEHTAHCLSMC